MDLTATFMRYMKHTHTLINFFTLLTYKLEPDLLKHFVIEVQTLPILVLILDLLVLCYYTNYNT